MTVGNSGVGGGGDITMKAGATTDTSATRIGGTLSLESGVSTSGSSGKVTLTSADSPDSGNVQFFTGEGKTGLSGTVELKTGNAIGVSGSITATVGKSKTNTGGNILLTAGSTESAGFSGGKVHIIAGTGLNATNSISGGKGGITIIEGGKALGKSTIIDGQTLD